MAEKSDSINYRELPLEGLFDTRDWRKIQDNFTSVTDIGLRIVNPEGAVILPLSKQHRLCRGLLSNTLTREKICGPCLPTFLHGKAVVDKNLSYYCESGLYNFVSPLALDDKNKPVAYLIIGPVILVMRKPKEQYRGFAQELGIELEEYWDALSEIKVISFHCAQSLIELIKDVAEYTLKLSCQRLMKERMIQDSPDSNTGALWLGSAKLNRLLDALLDVAFEISKADIGSVMFYDRGNNELTIKASRGLADDIVKSAKIKLDEGISGIAVKSGMAFLIDEATQDNRLLPYLSRPQISSSMVIPLKIEGKIMAGVMNMGALNTSSVRFTHATMELMTKLADLATVAIYPSRII